MITTAAEKTYPVDYSYFNIMGTAVGAHGIEADKVRIILGAKGAVRIAKPDG